MKQAAAVRLLDVSASSGRTHLKAISGSHQKTTVTSSVSLGDDLNEYIVYVAVPGMERKDFSVTIINRKLVVSAVKKEALHCFSEADEQNFAEWKETFELPEDADTVMTAAIYRNGELEIHIPRGIDSQGSAPIKVFVY